jgi:hypothetical protein
LISSTLSTYILHLLHSFCIHCFVQILVLPFNIYCFTIDLLILNHPSRIKVNYEPMVHIGSVKQSARIIMITIPSTISCTSTISYPTSISQATTTTSTSTDVTQAVLDKSSVGLQSSSTHVIHQTSPTDKSIGNGERAVCRFRFLYFPEYISTGDDMLIREDRTKGVGTVLRLY